MNRLLKLVQSLWQDEDGVTSIEYVLLASLIAMAIVVAVGVLGNRVCERYKLVAQALGVTTAINCGLGG